MRQEQRQSWLRQKSLFGNLIAILSITSSKMQRRSNAIDTKTSYHLSPSCRALIIMREAKSLTRSRNQPTLQAHKSSLRVTKVTTSISSLVVMRSQLKFSARQPHQPRSKNMDQATTSVREHCSRVNHVPLMLSLRLSSKWLRLTETVSCAFSDHLIRSYSATWTSTSLTQPSDKSFSSLLNHSFYIHHHSQ